jgi:hypothetical protein
MLSATGNQRRTGDFANSIRCYSDPVYSPSRYQRRLSRHQRNRDRLRRKPDGQAAASAQAGIVLGPVGHPVPLLGDVMAPRGIRFERQEGCSCTVEGPRPGFILPDAAPSGRWMQQGGVMVKIAA